MKWLAVVLVACSEPPLDKLGPDDVAATEQIKNPTSDEVAAEWLPIFENDRKFAMGCQVLYAVRIFGGWRSTVHCPNFDGVLVGTRDALWLTDVEADDVRKGARTDGVAFQGMLCFQGVCVRPFDGFVDATPTSW